MANLLLMLRLTTTYLFLTRAVLVMLFISNAKWHSGVKLGGVNGHDNISTVSPGADAKSGRPSNSGAARQIYGSSALRVYDWTTTVRTLPDRLAKSSAGNAYTERPYSHGTILTEPHPPDDASVRTVSNGNQQRQKGIVDLYGARTLGERGGIRDGGHVLHQGHMEVYVPQEEILSPDETLMDPSIGGGGGGVGGTGFAEYDECSMACLGTEFLCHRSCICVPKYMRCDGEFQCEDGEDEEDCTSTNEEIVHEMRLECETDLRHVMCPRTFECIAKTWLCDGDDDCGDFSDETRCGGERVNCSDDQYECLNGLCIQSMWLCDGDNDCKDFSDELNCTKSACTTKEFQCLDGNCISEAFKCDGDSDCADDSDELNCELPMSYCPEGEFKCKSFRGLGGENGKCILQRFRCDGDNDCGDWSDEEGCPATMSSCLPTEFKCGDGVCIPAQWQCDREQDCDSGEDEQNCELNPVEVAVEPRACSANEFTCKDGRCIMADWVCDGSPDCRRAEDELNCPTSCDVGQFSCPMEKNSTMLEICVQQKHICDGRKDCLNGEDELNCGTAQNCSTNSQCSKNCETFNGMERCTCPVGYVLGEDKHSCNDIDECQFQHDPVCSQTCTNTRGSFRCSCTPGYIMRPDLRTCKALGGSVKLIMANRADIREVSLSSNTHNSIVKGLHNVIALDYHYAKNLLFWSDVSTDVIRMSLLNGSQVKTIVKWGLETPGGLAVDWIHDLLFFTDSGTRRVEVITFDGKYRALVAANDLDKPRAVAVHPGEALVFWTDWGNGLSAVAGPSPKIERSYMDGSERQTIVTEGIFWPNGLAIDYPTSRIFWADAKHHVIESAGFDGRDRKKILSNGLPHPFALTIFEDLMIWTDWHTKKISAANKITGKAFRNVHEGMNFPMDIHSYHPSRQPKYSNRCKPDRTGQKGGCSHMCLPNRTGKRCSCPLGLRLKDDHRTCTSIPDKLLIMGRKKEIRIRQLDASKDAPLTDSMVVPLDGLKSLIALDWCSDTDSIYWTDVGRGSISRSKLDGTFQDQVITTNLLSPAGLALDWVTQKLYWTDPGTMRIEVSNLSGNKRALLVWKGLLKPRDIVLSPVDGIMFWSDWGESPKIERAGMDGSDRKALVTTNLKFPNGLAVDPKKNRLYFVDGGIKSLEYLRFDGSGRTVVVESGLMHPFGIDVFNNQIYWSDWDTQTVDVADKETGKNRRSLLNKTIDLMDVRVFHRQRPKISNPCANDNGGCSHLCLLSPAGRSCVCPIGIRSMDQRTCFNGPSKFIVLAHRIDIRLISLDIEYSVDVILPFPSMANAVAVDVDTKTGDVFWSDTIEKQIYRSSQDGKNVRPIIRDTLDTVDGLTVDSAGRKIYWTDSGRNTIEVSELDGSARTILIWQELDIPRGIAVDYNAGLMFWTDWGAPPKIERAQMDGSKRTRIVSASLVWPNGLSLDRQAKRVYWVDARKKQIVSVDYDGNDRQFAATNLPFPYGVAVSADQVFWTDWNLTTLNVLSKDKPQSHEVLLSGLQGLMDIKIVDKTIPLPENVCGANNGGCSHLCLRTVRGFKCTCPTGTSFVKDSNSKCNQMPDEYLLIALRNGVGRISLDTPEAFDTVLPIPDVYGLVVLDYHYNLSKLFLADVYTDVIKVVDLTNMTDVRTIVSTQLSTTNGLAVDWVANNLYWSDTVTKVIEVARLDGSCRKTILNKDLGEPRSLAVYPKRGYLFWTDWGKPARIERSFMDGSGRKAIADTNNGYPSGLSIDFVTRRIYWTDALDDRIDSCDFEGRKRATIIPLVSHPYGVALSGNSIYWTDWFNKSVFRAPLKGGAKVSKEIRHGMRGALDLRTVSRERQPAELSPCVRDNGGCSHLCLFRWSSYVCACPDVDDGRCRGETEHSTEHISGADGFDYSDTSDHHESTDHTTNDSDEDSSNEKKRRIIIIATIVISALLVIVLAAICVLFCKSKKQDIRTPIGSIRSILTFTNPNYNGTEPAISAPAIVVPEVEKPTIWKRLRYDKDQEQVYEEKFIGPEYMAITRNLMTPPSPSPKGSPSTTIQLSTISYD